jgi:hypothetical protein
MTVVTWIGVALQLLGAAATALGIFDTMSAFKRRGGTWNYQDRLSIWSAWFRVHVLRRPPKGINRVVSTHDSVWAVDVMASAVDSLPDIQTDPQGFAERVKNRLNHLDERLAEAIRQHNTERVTREGEVNRLSISSPSERRSSPTASKRWRLGGYGLRPSALASSSWAPSWRPSVDHQHRDGSKHGGRGSSAAAKEWRGFRPAGGSACASHVRFQCGAASCAGSASAAKTRR